MISDGARVTQGTSARTPFQVLSARQMKPLSQVRPDLDGDQLQPGKFGEHPSEIRLCN